MDILQISYVFLFSLIVIVFFTTITIWVCRVINKDVKTDKRATHISRLSYNSQKINRRDIKEH